ncbi:chaplin [Streptacidiphilus anmyonensis]|uniref:chaplin n=1 Tax=Streptacidiphilus anmyonensis TaxID=405782 RepID=UPI0005A93479|nr:chaplin [Streptacidiphilus anmyonensis]
MQKKTQRSLLATAMTAGLLAAGAGVASADSSAEGAAVNSPGFLSGNLHQLPIDHPINFCGNTISHHGALNPAFGNSCANAD